MTRQMDAIVADLRTQRQVVDAIEAELREAKRVLAETEDELMEVMRNQGLTRVSSQGLTLSINESIVPQLKAWEQFEAYVYRNRALHLLERRIHTTAWREELQTRDNTPIPGVEPWTRIRLSVRTD